MRLVVLTLLALVGGFAPGQDRPEPSPAADRARLEPPALEWFRKNLVPFQADVLLRSELQAFTDLVGDAQVIGLGEPTHGDQQAQGFKNQVIRELVRQGKVSVLVLEVNRSAGERVNQYVNGQGELTDVLLRGGIFQIWRTDDFANLIAWLRAAVQQSGKPFRVVGVDCQDPAEDLAAVFSFLDKVDRRAARKGRADFASLLESDKKGESLIAWTRSRKRSDFAVYEGLAQALGDLLDRNRARWEKRPGYAEARYAAKTARQALLSYEHEFGSEPVDYAKVPPEYWGRRDRFMGANLLERVGKDRAVVWAHDSHVQSWIPSERAQSGSTTLGVEVRKALRDAYVSVGFAWTRGVIHAKLIEHENDLVAAQRRPIKEFPLACDRPGDLGEFLARLDTPRFFVDSRKANADVRAWGNLAYYRGSLGWGVLPKRWLVDPMDAMSTFPPHDILVYFRTLSPSTLWRLPLKSAPTAGRG